MSEGEDLKGVWGVYDMKRTAVFAVLVVLIGDTHQSQGQIEGDTHRALHGDTHRAVRGDTHQRNRRDSLGPGEQARLSLHELDERVSKALRRESKARSHDERARAVSDLVEIFTLMQQDDRRALSPTLARLVGKVRSRLRRTQTELQREERRRARKASASSPGLESVAERSEPDGRFGGRAQLAAGNAQALIDLIERTISPNTWDVNGGPGTVMYYAPRHALVIRAPAEVHGRVGAGLQNLRRAGQ